MLHNSINLRFTNVLVLFVCALFVIPAKGYMGKRKTYSSYLYYREFQKHYTYFSENTIDFYKELHVERDYDKAAAKAKRIVSQIRDSKEKFKGTPDFKHEDSFLKRQYIKAYDSLEVLYTRDVTLLIDLKRKSTSSVSFFEDYDQVAFKVARMLYKIENNLNKASGQHFDKYDNKTAKRVSSSHVLQNLAMGMAYKRIIDKHYLQADMMIGTLIKLAPNQEQLKTQRVMKKLFKLQGSLDYNVQYINDLKDGSNNSNLYLKKSFLNSQRWLLSNIESRFHETLITLKKKDKSSQAYHNALIDLEYFVKDYQKLQQDFARSQEKWLEDFFDELPELLA